MLARHQRAAGDAGAVVTPALAAVRRPRVGWLLALPYPVRNMLRRWRDLVGMMLGVGIALGIGMTMLAVSNAQMEIFTGDFRLSGANAYVTQQGGNLVPLLPGDTQGAIRHGRSTLAYARSLPGVSGAVGILTWSLERQREGPKRRNIATELVVTMGVDGDPLLVPNILALREGRWLRRTDEAVLGAKLSREKNLRVGDSIRLADRDFSVVGIGKLRGFGFTADSLAYIDYRALRQRAEVGDVFSVIALRTTDPAATKQRIEELGSLSVTDAATVVKQAEEAQATAAALRWILILLTLAIAALFVSNMLSHSVAERRLEFATLRAIGIPSRTVLLTVGAEALLVIAAAGVIGLLISLLLGVLIDRYLAPQYGFDSLYAAGAGLFGSVFALALGLGVVSGLFPARQATKVDPVEVLREA